MKRQRKKWTNGTSKKFDVALIVCRKRNAEIEERKRKNAANKKAKRESPKGKSPWEKVLSNVELKESGTAGAKDLSRMRQVMLSRKSDFK